MATRYWFGGPGTWNASSTAHWAASSGITFTASCSGTTLTTVGSPALVNGMTVYAANGTSLGTITSGSGNSWVVSTGGTFASQTMGAQTLSTVPGGADNVIFDTNSGVGTVTVTSSSATCTDFTVTASQALTFSGTLSTLGGSLSYPSGGSVTVSALALIFTATATGKTITTGGKSTGAITFNGVGGGWTLSDALTTSGTNNITLTNGTFNTGNQTVTANGISTSNSNTRVLTLGSSAITLSGTTGFAAGTSTNLTINANTSTITFSSASTTTLNIGSGATLYNATFSASNTSVSITGAITFNNLTFTGPAAAAIKTVNLNSNITVSGTLTSSGSNGNQRVVINGNPSTITAAAVSLTDTDFTGITGAGAASWTGTRIGDGNLNSGITFTSPKTVYWNLAAGGNLLTTTGWATTSAGTPATTNYPLPQDTGIFTDAGLTTGNTITVSTAGLILPICDFTSRTTAMTFTISSNCYIAKGLKLNSTVTYTGSITLTVLGSTSISSSGATVTYNISLPTSAGFAITDNFVTTGAFTTVNSSTGITVTFNNNTITTVSYVAGTGSSGATFTFGSGKFVITGNAATVFNLGTTPILSGGDGFADFNYSGSTGTRTITTALTAGFNQININVTAGSDTVAIGFAKNLNFTGFSGTCDLTALSCYGDLTLSATMTIPTATTGITFNRNTGVISNSTITSNGKTLTMPITFGTANPSGSGYIFADAFTQAGASNALTVGICGFDMNGKTVTCNRISAGASATVTFNGGTLVITGSGATAFASAADFSAGSGQGKISMSSSSAKTFSGGSHSYGGTLEQAGSGALTISGSNTFYNISNTVQPTTITFTSGTTQTVSNFTVSGTSGNLVTLNTTTTSAATLSKSSGIVSVNYCTISYSTATGGASWQAYTINGNVDGGNNTGWIFTAPSGNGLLFGSNF